ncbi:MAG: hypothetical protein OK442_03270 [Thaumarchaeota archaeon]|nr:hypothetical protein [Nitrososphaerota archaeon]
MNVTEHEPEESVQLVAPKLPEPLLKKALMLPVGVGLAGVTVIVQFDATPTVTVGGEHTTVVVDVVPDANAGANERKRLKAANAKATETAIDPSLKRISILVLQPKYACEGCSTQRYKLSDACVYSWAHDPKMNGSIP